MSDLNLPQKRPSSSVALPRKQTHDIDNLDEFKSMNLLIKTFEEIKYRNIKCYHENCDENVVYECRCSNIWIITCQTHLKKHLRDDESKIHDLKSPKIELDEEKQDKLVNYLENYNSDLKTFKKKIANKVSDHIRKLNKEIDHLFQNIDSMVSKNKQRILDLKSNNQKVFENMLGLEKYIESDFQGEFTKEVQMIEISADCFNVLETEIYDWNLSKSTQNYANIHKMQRIHRQKLSCIQTWKESWEIISILRNFIQELKKPPLFSFERDLFVYFDWYDETLKSIKFDYDFFYTTRFIAIDQSNIIAFKNHIAYASCKSLVSKINLETQFIKNLAPINKGRTEFCLTYYKIIISLNQI